MTNCFGNKSICNVALRLQIVKGNSESFHIIEEYSAKRGISPQIMKIELVSISATESSFLHSVKVS